MGVNFGCRAHLFEGRLALTQGSNFNLGFFFFCSKEYFRIIFSTFFRASNHQIVGKIIRLNFLFELSYLNSNFALTLVYLNPALNNQAQKPQGFFDKCWFLPPFDHPHHTNTAVLSIIYLPSPVGTQPSHPTLGSFITSEIFTCSKRTCLCFLSGVIA